MDRALFRRPGPFGLGQVKRLGRERAVAARRFAFGGDAVGMIVGDRGEARFGGLIGAVAAQHRRRSEEHTSELQSLMRSSYAVFCLKKKKTTTPHSTSHN